MLLKDCDLLVATAIDNAKPTPVKPQERREIGAEFTWQTVQHPFSCTEDGLLWMQGGEPLAAFAACLEFPKMFVTRHSPVTDTVLKDQLWTLYTRSYARTAEEAVTHEMLDRLEFNDQLSDTTNRCWVVWEDNMPVAMTMIATDVRRTRWLSEHYFKKSYPQQFATNKVHYVVWAVVDPSYATKGVSMFMARQAMAVEAREGSLLVFDMPESNQPNEQGGAAELMFRMARQVGGAQLIPLTVQRYYALDFSPALVHEQETSKQAPSSYSDATL